MPLIALSIDQQDATPVRSPRQDDNVSSANQTEQLACRTPLRPEPAQVWSSSAAFGGSRQSGLFSSPDFDFFTDDDGSVPGKGRKRTKFGRKSSEWTLDRSQPDLDSRASSKLQRDVAEKFTEEGRPLESLEPDVVQHQSAQDTANESAIPNVTSIADEQTLPSQKRLAEVDHAAEIAQEGVSLGAAGPVIKDGSANIHLLDLTTHPFGESVRLEIPTLRPVSPRLDPVSSPGLSLVSPLPISFCNRVDEILDGGNDPGKRIRRSKPLSQENREPISPTVDYDVGLDGSSTSHVTQPASNGQSPKSSALETESNVNEGEQSGPQRIIPDSQTQALELSRIESGLYDIREQSGKRRQGDQSELKAVGALYPHVDDREAKSRTDNESVTFLGADVHASGPESRQVVTPDSRQMQPITATTGSPDQSTHDRETIVLPQDIQKDIGQFNIDSDTELDRSSRLAGIEPESEGDHLSSMIPSPAQDIFDEFLVSSPVRQTTYEPHQDPYSPTPATTVEAGDPASPDASPVMDMIQGERRPATLETPQDSQGGFNPGSASFLDALGVDPTMNGQEPLTPQMTLSNLSGSDAATTTESALLEAAATAMTATASQSVTNERRVEDVEAGQAAESGVPAAEASYETPKEKSRYETRRSLHSRTSDVPESVSPWFTSRSSGRRTSERVDVPTNGLEPKSHQTRNESNSHRETTYTNRDIIAPNQDHLSTPNSLPRQRSTRGKKKPGKAHDLPTRGFRTQISYYAPLSSLDTYLSASSSQGAITIDIFAVAKSQTSKPTRATKGPKDYHNLLHVMDPSMSPDTIQVQFFRPFLKSLPEADVGDVILLRDFAVKSRKKQCVLLSAESSAWLVWRHGSSNDSNAEAVGRTTVEAAREEINGPPLEIGDEERSHARKLREWWANVTQASHAPLAV